MSLFIIYTIISMYILINQVGTRRLVRWLHERYSKEAEKFIKNDKIPEELIAPLKKELTLLKVINKRRKPHLDLSLIITYIEFILIAGVTYLAIIDTREGVLNYDTLSKIGVVVIAWLGIKVLGYHGHWGLPIFGRSFFSVFLIGSVLNMFLAFLAGWVLSLIP